MGPINRGQTAKKMCLYAVIYIFKTLLPIINKYLTFKLFLCPKRGKTMKCTFYTIVSKSCVYPFFLQPYCKRINRNLLFGSKITQTETSNHALPNTT